MTAYPESYPIYPNEQAARGSRWSHLDPYERKFLKLVIQAYNEIMQAEDDMTTTPIQVR